MQLNEIFAKDIQRPIEGVIKADDESDLITEVSEYAAGMPQEHLQARLYPDIPPRAVSMPSTCQPSSSSAARSSRRSASNRRACSASCRVRHSRPAVSARESIRLRSSPTRSGPLSSSRRCSPAGATISTSSGCGEPALASTRPSSRRWAWIAARRRRSTSSRSSAASTTSS